MAKLYKTDNGAFYDAFGGKIGEVEEVEVEFGGDSFNRSTLTCSYDTASAISAEPASLSFTVKNCDWNSDALEVLSGVTYSKADKCSNDFVCNGTIKASDYCIGGSVDSLTNKLREMQEQIDELKSNYCATNKLCSALKTLQYKNEVE